ncbi:MAG: hypothetical protein ABI277_14285 [Burkholderiaceae bacterium]
MTAPYEQLRELILRKEEAFASFLYLDTRGFLTSGLGYLYVRDVQGSPPGASVQAHALSLLAQSGITLTLAQQGAVDGLVRAMNSLPADYTYPSFPRLALFNASPLGVALGPHLKLSSKLTDSGGAWTFRVDSAMTPNGWAPVETLFGDPAVHTAYFTLIVVPFEATIDAALVAAGGLTVTKSQRVGMFCAVWNRPAVGSAIASGLAANVSYDDMKAIVQRNRGAVAPERIALETDLVMERQDADTVFGT